MFIIITKLIIPCYIIILDSILIYPFNIPVVILTYLIMENTGRLLSHRLRYSNPRIDDIQFCEFLIRIRFLFCALIIWLIVFRGVSLAAMPSPPMGQNFQDFAAAAAADSQKKLKVIAIVIYMI